MRVLLPAAAALVFCWGASAQDYSNEPNTYRHGGTYATSQTGSDASCAALCGADAKCVVWSFRKPETGVGPSQCELKQSIGHAEINPLMISGVSPRLSGQGQATVNRSGTTDLLGGRAALSQPSAPSPLQYSEAPRAAPIPVPVHTPVRIDPAPRAPTQPTTITYTATPSRPTGRVLSPDDPRIIRRGPVQPAPVSATPAGTSVAAPAPVVQAQPSPAPVQRQPRPALQDRPYEGLRDREFPRYSVQETTVLEGDAPAGAGS